MNIYTTFEASFRVVAARSHTQKCTVYTSYFVVIGVYWCLELNVAMPKSIATHFEKAIDQSRLTLMSCRHRMSKCCRALVFHSSIHSIFHNRKDEKTKQKFTLRAHNVTFPPIGTAIGHRAHTHNICISRILSDSLMVF